MASPSSAALMSDVDAAPSSPAVHMAKSFMTAATEDDDNDDTKMDTATPEPSHTGKSDKPARNKKRNRTGEEPPPPGLLQNPGAATVGKIRHLKKEDGEPLWRVDIQYDFLRAVFDDPQKVFTNSYEPATPKQTFADLYIDTMARSSKTSKVLRDKLLSDREAAKGMAMVCLLVNIGRMNTTLNFFPEMRAQLRTYHAIPSLQAQQDAHAYKQLQDAPRLKSILKGGAEDRTEPTSLDSIKSLDVPRTNPVNLLFVICQAAAKIAELHFPPGQEFHDLIMKTNYSSRSRARAFLWIMWFYLESDFTEEGCEENPFGVGVDYGIDVANQGVPFLDELTNDEIAKENVDTLIEVRFGEEKKKMRAKILEADQQFLAETQTKRSARNRMFPASGDEVGPTTGILPRIRPSKHESDMDSVRSTPPPRTIAGRGGATSTGRRGGASLKYQILEGSSPGGSHHIDGVAPRKPRPPTAHQLAVERNRMQRVEYILDQGIRRSHHHSRKSRKQEGSIVRALNRLSQLQDPFDDSEDDDDLNVYGNGGGRSHGWNGVDGASSGMNGKAFPFRERGYGGLVQLKDEEDDFGEEFVCYGAALRRATRRLNRWENHTGDDLGVVRPVKRPRVHLLENGDDNDDDLDDDIGGSPSRDRGMCMLVDPDGTEDEADIMLPQPPTNRRAKPGGGRGSKRRAVGGSGRGARASALANGAEHGSTAGGLGDDEDDLNDVEKSLLGMADDGEGEGDGEADGQDGEDGEEELDAVEKSLLGIGGDSDSE